MRSLAKTTAIAAVGVLLLSGLPSEAQETTSNPQVPELKPLQPDHQRFQGTWKPLAVKDNGKEIEKQKREKTTITFSGNTMAMSGSTRTYKPEFTLDPTKTPHQIDLKFQGEGGTTVVAKGIYRFKGDNLHICTEELGRPRPTEFETRVGDKRSLMVLSRVEEGVSELPSEAQETTPNPEVPELKPMQRLIGSWDQHVVIKVAEWAPENTRMDGDVTANWILRGRVIEHRVIWSPDNTHGLALIAYDTEKNVYRQWYFDSNGTIPREELRGEWDEATKTITWKGRLPNGIMVTGDHRFIDKDTFEWSLTHKDRTGRVVLLMESKAKRKALVTTSSLQGQGSEVRPPELQPLQRFMGSWDWEVVSQPAQWTPEKTIMTGTAKVEWTLRGRMIEDKGVLSPGNIHCITLMAYDSENRVYQRWYFDSDGAIPRGEDRGTWDEATQTFTWKERWSNGITSTKTDRFIDKDTLERTLVFKDRTGKVLLDMEAKAKRK